MEFFPLSAVRLLDGPFARAQKVDRRFVLGLDPDRLLAPFLREAGLEPHAASYGNWESSGLDGHTGGHYLSALAALAAGGDDPEPRRRLAYALDELARAQDALGTGYLGGVPGGAALFESLRTGGVEAARALGSAQHWVPWYNLHKTFQGLLDAYLVAGEDRALGMLVALADWWLPIASGMDDETFEAMLDTEFGGMNDAYARLAALTGRADHAAMARRFAHRAILDPLLAGRDELTGRHANTQIPKAIGYATTALVTDVSAEGLDAAAFRGAADTFWRTVVEHRTVATGGNSVREHFHDRDDFTSMVDDREGPETCNTVNMLRLTRELAQHALRPEHLDYAERAVFNHLLSAQHPEQGGFVYFTPMRPRHYRVYSVLGEGFWCCVGTGIEAQARYGEWVFGRQDGALAVNLPIAAQVEAPDLGGRVRLDTDFPLDDRVSLTFDLDEPRAFPVRLRVPSWCTGLADLEVTSRPDEGRGADGRPADPNAQTELVTESVPSAIVVHRTWQPGDVLTYRLPLTLRAEPLPDGSPWQAYLAGPVVLAARADDRQLTGLFADDSRMGHVAGGPLRPFADLPIVAPGAGGLEPTAAPLRYRLTSLDGQELELEPFSGLHGSRYTVYFPVSDGAVPDGAVSDEAICDDALAARRERLVALDGGLALDARTLDRVAFGEQQPESDHAFRGEGERLTVGDRHARSTRTLMSVELRDDDAAGQTLRVGLRTPAGLSALTLRLAGVTVGRETFDPGPEALDLDFPVAEALAAAGHPTRARLEVVADEGLPTPALTTVRLLRWAP